MAALPIACYYPREKYGYGNVNPEEAVQIHQDVLAMCSLAVGWGTFILSNEVSIAFHDKIMCKSKSHDKSTFQEQLVKHLISSEKQ